MFIFFQVFIQTAELSSGRMLAVNLSIQETPDHKWASDYDSNAEDTVDRADSFKHVSKVDCVQLDKT